jgi:hypothetical protein
MLEVIGHVEARTSSTQAGTASLAGP